MMDVSRTSCNGPGGDGFVGLCGRLFSCAVKCTQSILSRHVTYSVHSDTESKHAVYG